MRDKLEKRFQLSYLNRATYLGNLRKLSTWRPCNTGTEVRKLYDYVTENVDLLELCGGNSVNESEFLLSDILALIPSFMVNQFLELKPDERSLKKLMKIIDECVERMLEKDVLVPKGKNQSFNNKFSSVINSNRFNNNSPRSNFQTYRVDEASNFNHDCNSNFDSGQSFNSNRGFNLRPNLNNNFVPRNQCFFCSNRRPSFTCNVNTVNDRLAKAWEQKVCHNC